MAYDPIDELNEIFQDSSSINDVSDILAYITSYKLEVDKNLNATILEYKQPPNIEKEAFELMKEVKDVKKRSLEVHRDVANMTSSIQEFDNCKKNLVLLMTVLKRLQMLVHANDNLKAVLREQNYKDILQMLSVVKELLNFFKPYKSIDEINHFNIMISRTENKLVDDIFIDFEDKVVNDSSKEGLVYGCEILLMIDPKYKNKLLNWFYNVQLREIKDIFNVSDEAGSLDNLERRYIYFNNVLANVDQKYKQLFPENWNVDVELSKIFCSITKQDLYSQLNSSIPPSSLLNSLTKTIEFEKNLNTIFDTTEFYLLILKVFEPYFSIWVKDQENVLSSKLSEAFSVTQVPDEYYKVKTYDEFLSILKVNSVPNIANSSMELFKSFQKIMNSALKISSGRILLDLSRLFGKYIGEYRYRVLSPMIPESKEHFTGIEPLKHLTMVLNTADFVLNNTNDLEERLKKVIDSSLKDQVNFDKPRDEYISLISKAIQALLRKISVELEFPWREFVNNNWKKIEHTVDASTYIIDFEQSIVQNCAIILPLIIREGYARNFCDKLAVVVAESFLDNLRHIVPLNIMSVEQIMKDINHLKQVFLKLPYYADPNFEGTYTSETLNPSYLKPYKTHAENQFEKVITVLKLLEVPVLPIDHFMLKYFDLIGDKSEKNFEKILLLKRAEKTQIPSYVEAFKKKAAFQSTLIESSGTILGLQVETYPATSTNTPTSPKSPNLDPRSSRLWNTNFQVNNLEKNLKDLALSGENQVYKFKNFGKLFRKDNRQVDE